jgi:hypothetical protein
VGTADEENQFLEDAYQELGKDSFHFQSLTPSLQELLKVTSMT